MKINKFFLSLILISLSGLVACSSGNLVNVTIIKGNADFKDVNLEKVVIQKLAWETGAETGTVYLADAGNGNKTSASFSVKLNLGNSFKTKSKDGALAKTVAAMQRIRLYLVNSNSPGLLTTVSGPFNITSGLPAINGGTRVIRFLNIPQGSYFVAAAAFNHPINNALVNNITDINSLWTVAGEGNYILGNAGGEVPVNPGRVTVGAPPGFTVTGISPILLPLNLASAVGAVITSTVTVTDG